MFAYLDNSATTKPCPEAVAAMVEALETGWGNPSSLYRFGMDAARRLKAAREQVAKALGAESDRVFFTSGGTEADNWAVASSLARMGKRGRHVITTAVEHHAILNPMKRLEEQGYDVTYLKPDALGRVTLDALQAAIRPDTVLVSVMMVNNESGAVMPIGSMAKLTHRLAPDAIFHTDAVQGCLKLPFQAKTLGADLISVSSHKVHGPKGAGALYIRRGLPLPPLLLGGRSGGRLSQRHRGHARPGGLRGRLCRCPAHAPGGSGPGGGPPGPVRRSAGGNPWCGAAGGPGSAPHSPGLHPRCAHAKYHQHPAGPWGLRLCRFRLCQGAPEPCAGGHGPSAGGGGWGLPNLPQPFYRRRRAGAAGGWAAHCGGAYAASISHQKTRGCLKTNFETASCLSFQKAVFHLHPVQLFQHGLGQEPEEEKGGGSVDQVRRQTG